MKPLPEEEYTRSKDLAGRPPHTTTPVQPPATNEARNDQSEIFGNKLNTNLDNVNRPMTFEYDKPLFSPTRHPEEEAQCSAQASGLSDVNGNVVSDGCASGSSGTTNCYLQKIQRQEETPLGAKGNNLSQIKQPQANTGGRNSKPARHPEYAYHSDRLQSFSIYRWDEATRPSAEKLVNSGLLATDRGDLVRCFQCGLGLKDWAKDDDPLVEHVKYSTDCDFLTQTLGRDKLIRFKNALTRTTTAQVADINHEPAAARNSTLPYAVRSPRFMAMEDRMSSFVNFPPTITQSHRELALAGLYYTGEDDICRCFTCDGGLKNWVPGDDPMEEHAKYFPQCPYLIHIKDDNFVELVRQRMQAVNVTAAPTGQAPVHRSGSSPGQAAAVPPVSTPAFRHDSQDQDVGEILRSPAGRSILQMGYSEEVVRRAIKQLISRGIKHPSAQQTMELILDYEKNGNERSSVYGASNQANADEDVLTGNEHLKAMEKCIICKTRERNILCIPCSHHRMCQECARDVTSCPTCGKYIQQKVKTYMS